VNLRQLKMKNEGAAKWVKAVNAVNAVVNYG
jgi:hypothetical protein